MAVIGVCSLPLSVAAVDANVGTPMDRDFMSGNDIPFYDRTFQKSSAVCSTGGGDLNFSTGETAKIIFDFFTQNSFSTNGNKPMSDVQASALLGNFHWESGGLDPARIEGGTGIGLGLAQWSFDRRTALEAEAARRGKDPTDLQFQLEYIKFELEGAESAVMNDPRFKSGTVEEATLAVSQIYERPNPALAHNDERIKHAKQYLDQFKGQNNSAGTTSNQSSSGGCATGGAVTGDILQTALNFAWPDVVDEGKWQKADAKQEYVTAMAMHSNITKDTDAIAPFSDCGRFISNVMRSSGADPDYPLVSTPVQEKYVRSKPDLYQIIENPTLSDFQPGDIIIWPAHTAMFTGVSGKDTVDASLHVRDGQGRVPSQHNMMQEFVTMSQGQSVLARYKGAPATN